MHVLRGKDQGGRASSQEQQLGPVSHVPTGRKEEPSGSVSVPSSPSTKKAWNKRKGRADRLQGLLGWEERGCHLCPRCHENVRHGVQPDTPRLSGSLAGLPVGSVAVAPFSFSSSSSDNNGSDFHQP